MTYLSILFCSTVGYSFSTHAIIHWFRGSTNDLLFTTEVNTRPVIQEGLVNTRPVVQEGLVNARPVNMNDHAQLTPPARTHTHTHTHTVIGLSVTQKDEGLYEGAKGQR